MDLLAALGTSWTDLRTVVVTAVLVYLAVILLTRLAGPRSLATMSSFDFAATVAVGSTVAATAGGSASLSTGVLVLAILYGLQYALATLRRRPAVRGLVDNQPLLLMAGPSPLHDNLRHGRVTEAELYAQLRQAGVQRLAQVRAVVLETTGDMSVLTDQGELDEVLLRGVRGSGALALERQRPGT